MLADTSIEAVCQMMDNHDGTNMRDIMRALQLYGYAVTEFETGLRPNHPLPDDAIVGWVWPGIDQSHWLLRFAGQMYDPDGIPPSPNLQIRSGGWVCKYIAFSKR